VWSRQNLKKNYKDNDVPSSPKVCGVCMFYVLHCSRYGRDIFVSAFALVNCSVPGLSEFSSPVVSLWQSRVCDIPSAHLQSWKTCNRQDIRAEPQSISANVTCSVPGLSVFYSLVVSIYEPWVCLLPGAHLLDWIALIQRHIFFRKFLQL